jgi:hypothetical protein
MKKGRNDCSLRPCLSWLLDLGSLTGRRELAGSLELLVGGFSVGVLQGDLAAAKGEQITAVHFHASAVRSCSGECPL